MTKRVLLDEGVPRQLAAPLEAAGFSATPYPPAWKQIKNGELLKLAEDQGYDVLITSDKNIYAQQKLRGRSLSSSCCPRTFAVRSWNAPPILLMRSMKSNCGSMLSLNSAAIVRCRISMDE